MALFGTLAVAIIGDASKFNDEMDKAEKKSGSFGDKFGKVASAVGKAAIMGLAAAGAAFTGLAIQSLNLAGELEQNIGGSEAVFGRFASTVQEKASTAFETMGLSASDFMATANKMGALMQGSGVDIETSMNLSTQAMQRAADVASIMGIDIGAAMESIAGAAKGNFTMMDNLGVAMNATTLESYALSKGVETSWKEMDNATKVGLAMEMFLENTAYAAGNYAKENETLAGSLNTAKAALKNFLSGAGSPQDVSKAFSNAADVIVQNFQRLLPGLVSGLTSIISSLIPKVPELLSALLPAVVEGASALISGFIAMAPRLLDAVLGVFPDAIKMLASGLGEALPVLKPLTDMLSSLADNFDTVLHWIIPLTAGIVAYNAVVGIQTALQKSSTIATIADTAAKVAASFATGGLTAAMGALNAVMAINPVALIIAGVAALTAGIISLVKWINRDTEEQKALKQSTEDLANANNGLLDSIDSSAKSYTDNAKGIEANAAASENLADKVYELAAIENKSEEQKKKLAVLVDQLNESMPDLNLQYDMEADALSKTEEETRKLIAAKKEEIKYQAAAERAVEIAKEQADAERQLAETTSKRLELEKRKSDGLDKSLFGGFKLQAQLDDLIAQEGKLTAQVREHEDALNAVTETMVESEKAARAFGDIQEEVALRIKTADEIQEEIASKAKAREDEYTKYLQDEANKREMTIDEFTKYLGDDLVKRMAILDEETLRRLDIRDEQERILAEQKTLEDEYTQYLTEEANKRGMSYDAFVDVLGSSLEQVKALYGDELNYAFEIKEKQQQLSAEKQAIEDGYTTYLMEQANQRGLLLDEYTVLLGENVLRNKAIIDDELNHAIDVRLEQESILQQRAADEEAYTLAMTEQANMRGMTLAELEQLQEDAAARVEEVNQRILSAYQTMTASLGNVNQQIKLDSRTTWESVQKNQTDMIAKTEEFSGLYAQLIKAGVSESYLDAIGATGPESIPLLRSMIKAGTDEVKKKEGEWKEAYGTIQDGLAGALSDDKETKAAISEYISGNGGVGPSIKAELEAALKAADLAGVAKAIPEGVGKGITDNLIFATDKVKNMAEETGKAFKGGIQSNSPSELFAGIAESIPQGVGKGIERVWSTVTATLSQLISQTKTHTSSAVTSSNFPAVGSSIVQGMISGLNSMASSLYSAVTSMAQTAAQKARDTLQIKSPSGIFKEIGQMTGQGFVDGIDAMKKEASDAIRDLVSLPDITSISTRAADSMQAAGMALPLIDGIAGSAMDGQAVNGQEETAGGKNPIVVIVKSILDGHELGYAATGYINEQQGFDVNNALRAAGVMP